MRKRQIAVSAMLALFATALTPMVAHADSGSPTTYYVSPCSSAAGVGTRASPFCSIQQAAAVATVPGDKVLIEPGIYTGEVDITASGTASAPIVFEQDPAAGPSYPVWIESDAAINAGIVVSGASYVDFEKVGVAAPGAVNQIRIVGSSHISVDRSTVTSYGAGPTISIAGSSSDVTISRSRIGGQATTDDIDIISAGSGIVLTTNRIGLATNAVAVSGTPGVTITSNTINAYCQSAISLTDTAAAASSGASIQNNLISAARTCTGSTSSVAVSVASVADAAGLVENYNDVYPGTAAGASEYSWEGTVYPTQAAYSAATGQGAADVDSDPNAVTDSTTPRQTSPLIDSANSDAPGELDADYYGQARYCDPNILPSGVGHSQCYDRGAVQLTDALTPPTLTAPVSMAPVGAALTFSDTAVTSNWAGADITYTFTFDDGTVITGSTPTATHAFTAPGYHSVTLQVSDQFGGIVFGYAHVSIVPPTPLAVAVTTGQVNTLSAQAFVSVQSAWTVTGESINWGDGSSTPVTSTAPVEHTYATAGLYTVTASATDAGGETASQSTQFATVGTKYTAFGPTRLLDTRKGEGGTSSQLAHNGQIALKVAGVGGIPSDVTAVALNLTALNATGAGYITVADNGARTMTSTVNYNTGGTFTNSVIAPVGADGTVLLANNTARTATTLDLLADISGYFTAQGAAGYTPVTPARIMDTRSGLGGSSGPLAAGHTDVLTIAGADKGTLPVSGVTAVAINLTMTGTAGNGYLAAYPDGGQVPGTSNENWSGSTTKAITAIVPVGKDGKIDIRNGGLAGSAAQVIVDVTGYFSGTGTSLYVPVTPQRLLDTRTTGAVPGGSAKTLTVPASAAWSSSAGPNLTAWVFNTTVTQTNYPGWLAVLPHGATPASSSLNWTGANQTAANLTITPNGPGNEVDFYNSGSPTHSVQVIGDLTGYFTTS